jgi:hypothetical protein
MRITLVAMLIIFSSMNAALGACEGETCIDVKANQESNEVVITVKKGKAGSQVSTTPKPNLNYKANLDSLASKATCCK